MKYLIMCIMLVSACECYRLLALLPYPGKSHHMVFEPVLDELTKRGHNVTVVSFFPSKKLNANRRDVSLVGLAPLSIEVVDLKGYDNVGLFPGQDFINQFALIHTLTKDSIQLCEKLLSSEVFEEFVNGAGDYDAILVEHFNSDCMLGIIHNYGLPSIGLISCTLMPWTSSWVGGNDNPATVPSMMLPFTDEMTFLEKLENSFDLFFHKYWHRYVSMNEQRLLETRLGRRLPPLEQIGRNASVVLINTYHALNGVRVLPPSVIEVGGIHLHKRSMQQLSEDLEQWVAQSKHGVLIVSFGSLIRGSTLPPKQLNAMLKVFARLSQRVVWKWESQSIEDLPENVLVMKWIPQYELLRHPNCVAFMTHGGLLSLTEAVASGVPALVIPILGDQPGNAAYAKRAGVAEVLSLHKITEENLYEALTKVLSSEMRARAKDFSKLWWDRPLSPMDTAIYYIEKTVRYGNLNMSSHARLLSEPHLVFFNSIVYIFTIIIFCVIIFIILSCCYWPNRLRGIKVKQS